MAVQPRRALPQLRQQPRKWMALLLCLGLCLCLLLAVASSTAALAQSIPLLPLDGSPALRSCANPLQSAANQTLLAPGDDGSGYANSRSCAPPFANAAALALVNVSLNLAAATLVGFPVDSAAVSTGCLASTIPLSSLRRASSGVRVGPPLAFASSGQSLNVTQSFAERWGVDLANPCASSSSEPTAAAPVAIEYPFLEWNVSFGSDVEAGDAKGKVSVQLLGLGGGYLWGQPSAAGAEDPSEYILYDLAFLPPPGPPPPAFENLTALYYDLRATVDVCADATNARCRPYTTKSAAGFSLAQEGVRDQLALSASNAVTGPTSDSAEARWGLVTNATYTWYRRLFPVPAKWGGLVANAFLLSVDNPFVNNVSVRVRNIQIVDSQLHVKRIVYPPVAGYSIANYSLRVAYSDPSLGRYDEAGLCVDQGGAPGTAGGTAWPTTRNCTDIKDYQAIVSFTGSFWPVRLGSLRVTYGSATLAPGLLGLLILPCTILHANASSISCQLTSGYPDSMRLRVCDAENFLCSAQSADTFVYPPATLVPRSMFDQSNPAKTFQHWPPNYFLGPNPGYLFLGFKLERIMLPSAVAVTKKTVPLFNVYYGPATSPRLFRCHVLPTLTEPDTVYCNIDSSATAQSFSGAFMRFTFVIGYQTVLSNMTFSYRSYPVIRAMDSLVPGVCTRALDGVGLSNCPTRGGYPVVLRGDSLFPPYSVLFNGRACVNATMLGEDSDALSCIVPAATGSSVAIVVSAAFTLVPYTFTSFSYASPRVDSITGCAANLNSLGFVISSGCAREGGDLLTITGGDFGSEGAAVFVGGRACRATTHDATSPHSILYCLTPQNAGTRLALGIAQRGGSTTSDPTRAVGYSPCAPGTRELSAIELLDPSTELQACVECTAGKFTSVYGSSECTSCQLGSFSNSTGATACLPCPPRTRGVTNATTGLNTCEVCPTFTQGGAAGAVECLSCPSTDFAQLDSAGTFLQCHRCPEHSLCLTNSSANVVLAQGDYWITSSARGAVSSYRCDPGKCLPCDPAQIAAFQSTSSSLTSSATNTSGSSIGGFASSSAVAGVVSCCGPNRLPAAQNPLCAACQPGFVETGSDCVSCASPNVGLIVVLILASFAYIVLFHRVAQSTSGLTKIFLYHVSTVVTLLGPQTSLVAVFNLFQFNLFESSSRSTCIAPMSDAVKLLLGVILPFVSLLMLLCVFLVHLTGWRFCSRARCRASRDPRLNQLAEALSCCETAGGQEVEEDASGTIGSDELAAPAVASTAAAAATGSGSATAAAAAAPRFKFHKSPYFRTCLGLFLFSYNSTSLSILAFFSCRKIDALDTSFISTNLSISCDSGTYSELRVAFVLLLVFLVVLAPLLLLALLVRGHLRGILRDPKILSRWGIVYESYSDGRYFYEVVVIARRILLIALTVLLVNDAHAMFVALTVLNLGIYLLHSALQPFRTSKENSLESFSLVSLTLLSAFLIVYPPPFTNSGSSLADSGSSDSSDRRGLKQAVLIILTFIPGCILSIFVIVYLYERIRSKLQAARESRSGPEARAKKLQGRELSARSIAEMQQQGRNAAASSFDGVSPLPLQVSPRPVPRALSPTLHQQHHPHRSMDASFDCDPEVQASPLRGMELAMATGRKTGGGGAGGSSGGGSSGGSSSGSGSSSSARVSPSRTAIGASGDPELQISPLQGQAVRSPSGGPRAPPPPPPLDELHADIELQALPSPSRANGVTERAEL